MENNFSNLPKWDLTDLYSGIDDNCIDHDIDIINSMCLELRDTYKGKLSLISGDNFFKAIELYENINEKIGKLISYCSLLSAVNSSDIEIGGFYQTITEKVTKISTSVLFFTLEINKIEDKILEDKLSNSESMRFYESWLRDLRMSKKHQLSDEIEEILYEKSVCGSSSWIRLFTQTMADLRFKIDDKMLNESEVSLLMQDKDEKTREKSCKEMARVLNKNIKTFHLITNTLAKDKEVMDRLRGFKTPVSSRNLSNLVDDDVIDSLVYSVKNNYSNISHRYYRLKAKLLGKEKLKIWDRNAPLNVEDDDKLDYQSAVDLVLSAYKDFSPKLHDVATLFFDNSWIDVGVRDGKRSGAFAHPCVPSVHPYLLLNYQGKQRDVMTLAHELGHGCHQVLSSSQGYLKSQTPLILAEMASVFGEMITFRKILDLEKDTKKKALLLASKVEDMINTVVRQISFFEFERMVHTNRKEKELSVEELCNFWLQSSKESLGDAFEYDDFYSVFWSYIPHFIHSPFYVYSYSFGDCLVNTLYSLYQEGYSDFEDKYIDVLSFGGSKRYNEVLDIFNLNATDKNFWNNGLSVINSFVNELEETFKE